MIEKTELVLRAIKRWMAENWLALNDDKTELMVISTRQQCSLLKDLSINIGCTTINPNNNIRNLGVIFDSSFQMNSHVSHICKKAYLAIRSIGQIRKFLDKSSTEKLINSLITSHLDYCNSLLYLLPAIHMKRLQRIQNTAARIILRVGKFEHITPSLITLHWLPISRRIEYKILLFTYKALNDAAPSYISDMLNVHKSVRPLRSRSHVELVVPKTRLRTFGDKSFEKAAPELWNALPESVKCAESINLFKKRLKTHLFRLAYESD